MEESQEMWGAEKRVWEGDCLAEKVDLAGWSCNQTLLDLFLRFRELPMETHQVVLIRHSLCKGLVVEIRPVVHCKNTCILAGTCGTCL